MHFAEGIEDIVLAQSLYNVFKPQATAFSQVAFTHSKKFRMPEPRGPLEFTLPSLYLIEENTEVLGD